MKRKNTQHPNPLDLLNNLHNRKSEHQKLQVNGKTNRPLSKRHQRLNTDDTLYRQSFRLSAHKHPQVQGSMDLKPELRSISASKNKSLKQIYCKSLLLSPREKKKPVLTPKTHRYQFKHEYDQILELLTVPVQPDLNEMIMDVNQKFQSIFSLFHLDKFICKLFSRVKTMVGVLLETALLDSINKVTQQQKSIMEDYKLVLQQNKLLNARIQEIRADHIKVEQNLRKLSRISEEHYVELAEKMRKEKEVNELIYQLRMSGVDIDHFYMKMKDPQYESRFSQDTFTQKNLSKATI